MTNRLQFDQVRAILLLRFRTENPDKASLTYMSYPKIKIATGISVNVISYACWKTLNSVMVAKTAKAK